MISAVPGYCVTNLLRPLQRLTLLRATKTYWTLLGLINLKIRLRTEVCLIGAFALMRIGRVLWTSTVPTRMVRGFLFLLRTFRTMNALGVIVIGAWRWVAAEALATLRF